MDRKYTTFYFFSLQSKQSHPMAQAYMMFLYFFVFLLVLLSGAMCISSPGAVSSFSPGAQYIMLTFNAPNAATTTKILDILSSKKARATFFVTGVGSSLDEYKPLLGTMKSDGHELALYGSTQNHASFTRIPRDKISNQLSIASQHLHSITGKHPKYVRPPLGQTNAHINEHIKVNASMQVALWSIDAGDNEPASTLDSIFKAVTEKCSPGDIVLFHCIRDIVVTVLPTILDGMTSICIYILLYYYL